MAYSSCGTDNIAMRGCQSEEAACSDYGASHESCQEKNRTELDKYFFIWHPMRVL